jgi:ribose 5-phosphate isomerase
LPIGAHIQVEGLKEFQQGLRDAQNKLPKALGEAHKRVGTFIISKLPEASPEAVGIGTGSTVRASATKRDVILRAGTTARVGRASEQRTSIKAQQWGKTEVQPFEKGGRPYIVGTIEEHQDEIVEMFKEEMLKVVGGAFYSAR